MTISAVVPSYRRWQCLLTTVKMLLSQTRVPDEIIIVDQTPRDEIPNEQWYELLSLRSAHRFIYYLRQEEPLVYRARNLAAARATTEFLLYLDDDVLISKTLVEDYLEVLKDTAADAVVGYSTERGSEDEWVACPPQSLCAVDFAFAFQPRVPYQVREIPYVCAGNMVIRRSVLLKLGGWDENVLTYGDKDLGFRLCQAGCLIVYDPSPKVVHLAAPTGGTRLSDKRSPWSPWERCVSIHYLAFRHMRGSRFWKYGPSRAARYTFLLKRNALRPWRWLPELLGWVKGLVFAYLWAKKGPKLPFLGSNASKQPEVPE